jgi:acetyl/propionyl-CoA carboxylase alpha subunit
MGDTEPEAIMEKIASGHRDGRFSLPGRLKAANGGGGRGQAVVETTNAIASAVQKVLGEIAANGWEPGVMFEQNIPHTIHLEVQVVRDRYGNTRHFGMRDCSEQRASQKIQEEAPPALLRDRPKLQARMCEVAVRIADAVDYVGACTVELMFKDGHFYLLEMNTRIQVEHPVTEEAHQVRVDGQRIPLNLVRLQLEVARGAPISFEQDAVECTHLAREFRINAEAYRSDIKDSRDGQRGMFLPNAGIFDVVEVPTPEAVLSALEASGVVGLSELSIRFDTGFEIGDVLVNKDPTFGKLIVAVQTSPGRESLGYELLRLASIEVLKQTRIEGRKVLPSGKIIRRSKFETNIADHIFVLETQCLQQHSRDVAPDRHVNWVIEAFRGEHE